MSGSVEEKIFLFGISGANNFTQVGNMTVIGQQSTAVTNQYILPSTSLKENSIWFDVREPVESFTGRNRELENFHNLIIVDNC
jgi:hypothetical protein